MHLDIGVPAEACPLNLAPTASTTAALAVGDALAVALLKARGFTEEDFARSHPAGALGRRLLLHVRDVMRTGAALPKVPPDMPLAEGLMEVTRKGLGMTAIVEAGDRVLGVFTDGDLRRALDRAADLHRTRMDEVMTRDAKRVHPDTLAAEAVLLMETHRITSLIVVDADECAGRRPQRARPAARGCRLRTRVATRVAARAATRVPAPAATRSGARRPTPLAAIELLMLDVDGVLTDGRLYFAARGEALKSFHVRDGHGIKLLMQSGVAVAVEAAAARRR